MDTLWARLDALVDDDGHIIDSIGWERANEELEAVAAQQREALEAGSDADRFSRYAEEYDALIGQPNLDAFMKRYLGRTLGDLSETDVLSVGCGTALVEQHLIDAHAASPRRLYGVDLSAAMVQAARRRIRADVMDLFDLPGLGRTYDLAYSGLNVLQYVPASRFPDAVRAITTVVRPGGRFVGDFITPDHIRRYPNLVRSGDGLVTSLRTARLVADEGRLLQESRITNVSFVRGPMVVEHVGRHRRVLPPVVRIRRAFERAFGGPVALYDAVSGDGIPEEADTCASTRFVVVAERAAA